MKIITPQNLSAAGVFRWNKDYLFKVLTTGKNPPLEDPKLIAAFRNIDREHFVPNEFKARAYEDGDIDIGYDEVLTRPTTLAKMAELIKPKFGGKYLDIGSGTGYFAAILGFVAGPQGSVYGLERVQWIWEASRNNIKRYKDINNVNLLYKDGMKGLPEQAPYDGIHVSFAMQDVSEDLKMQLSMEGGKLVVPTINNDIRFIERQGQDDYIEEIIPGHMFKEGKEGVA